MADNTFDSPFGGIEDTIEGIGNTELLRDLLSPESSTSSPEDISPIKEPPVKVKEPPVKSEEEPKKPEDANKQNLLSSFLEEEEEENKEPDTPPIKKEGEESEEKVTQFGALAKDLFKLGVFTPDEEEEETPITTAQEFLDRFNTEKKRGAGQIVDEFIGRFGEDYQNAFTAIYVKGVDPKEYFGIYNEIVDLANLDLKVEDNQIAVLKRALNDQGFEPEEITTEIERVKSYGDLEVVSTRYHKALVKKDAAKLQQKELEAEQFQKQKEAIKSQYMQNVQNILQEKLKTKEFDGIPLNPKLVSELQDFLLTDRYRTPSGELLTEFDKTILDMKKPENHATKVKVALLLKILEKDPTLSTIQRAGITKKTDQLFGEVARLETKSKGGTAPPKKSSWFLE